MNNAIRNINIFLLTITACLALAFVFIQTPSALAQQEIPPDFDPMPSAYDCDRVIDMTSLCAPMKPVWGIRYTICSGGFSNAQVARCCEYQARDKRCNNTGNNADPSIASGYIAALAGEYTTLKCVKYSPFGGQCTDRFIHEDW